MKPTLHVIGLSHTIVSQEYSHCAFTGKILRFAKMMQMYGWKVVEYSNGKSESGAKQIEILSKEELRDLSLRKTHTEDYSADIHNEPLKLVFMTRLKEALLENTADGDIVCHVFGPYRSIAELLPRCRHIESGIGYPCTDGVMPYRVYESSAWMHWHLGRRHLEIGKNYETVIPNYYDLADWDVVTTSRGFHNKPLPTLDELIKEEVTTAITIEALRSTSFVLFFGRIISSKGLCVIVEVAKRMPEILFVICGQGKPDEYLSHNVKYLEPIHGRARSELLGLATVMIAPTNFIEPFCGSAVEAQLVGTPIVSTNWGAFTETVEEGKTGFRCNTLGDFIDGIRKAEHLDRSYIAERARSLYSLERVGKLYDKVFSDVSDLNHLGWYTTISHK